MAMEQSSLVFTMPDVAGVVSRKSIGRLAQRPDDT